METPQIRILWGVGSWAGCVLASTANEAGSRTLEKSSQRDWDRDCAKFESSRRFRGSNMKPKKKSCRCRGLGLDSGLDLAISRFIHSLGWGYSQLRHRITYTMFFFEFGHCHKATGKFFRWQHFALLSIFLTLSVLTVVPPTWQGAWQKVLEGSEKDTEKKDRQRHDSDSTGGRTPDHWQSSSFII